jgi:hypothetical protein
MQYFLVGCIILKFNSEFVWFIITMYETIIPLLFIPNLKEGGGGGKGGGAGGGGGEGISSRISFLDFTSHEKQNFIFTIFRNTEA